MQNVPQEIATLLLRVARERGGFRFMRSAPLESVAVRFEVPPAIVDAARSYLETPERRDQLASALAEARRKARGERAAESDGADAAPHLLETRTAEEIVQEFDASPSGPELLLQAPPETLAVLFDVPPSVIFAARDLLDRRESP